MWFLALATDVTTAVNVVAAIGQVGGAIAAVWAVWVATRIAGRDRRDRVVAEEVAALAQARLVWAVCASSEPAEQPTEDVRHYSLFYIDNQSDTPITDVHYEVWFPPAKVTDRPPAGLNERILLPGAGRRPENQHERPHRVPISYPESSYLVAWRVRWTDHHGRQWCRDIKDEPPRRYQPGDAPREYGWDHQKSQELRLGGAGPKSPLGAPTSSPRRRWHIR